MSEPSSASMSRPATSTLFALSPTSSLERPETKSASSIDPAPPCNPEGGGVAPGAVVQFDASVMPFGQSAGAGAPAGDVIQFEATVLPFGQSAPVGAPTVKVASAPPVIGPTTPSTASPRDAWNAFTAARVRGPKYIVSSPGEPAPVAETKNPFAFKVCCRLRTCECVIPILRVTVCM